MSDTCEMPLNEDFLIGAEAIGAALGLSRRQAYYMLETGRLPVFRLGGKWCARRSRLMSHIEDLENLEGSKSTPVDGDA